MNNSMNVDNVKGTRDVPPEQMIIREDITSKIKSVFRQYGFVPLQTPALENFNVLSAKGAGSEDIGRETYSFEKEGRMIGLKFDQTVPLARFVAMNPQLSMPFKRYQYDRAWRYGEVLMDRGRYREFEQFDIDTVGSEKIVYDAEIATAAINAVKELGLDDFKLYYNNRKFLNELLDFLRIKNKQEALRIIDKLDKKTEKDVLEELKKEEVNNAKKLLEYVKKSFGALSKEFPQSEGMKELKEFRRYLKIFGSEEYAEYQGTLTRGLDYYTGTVFEMKVEGYRSIAGGGRYDNLIGLFKGEKIPAVGIALGIDSIIDTMIKKELIKEKRTVADTFIAVVDEKSEDEAIKLAETLRRKGNNVEVNLTGNSLKSQLRYAGKKEFENVIILGQKDIENKQATLKNMKTGKEKKIKL